MPARVIAHSVRTRTEVSFELEKTVLSESVKGKFKIVRYPGFMLGPAMAVLEKKRMTDTVRIDLHLSQGTIGCFDLWIPV